MNTPSHTLGTGLGIGRLVHRLRDLTAILVGILVISCGADVSGPTVPMVPPPPPPPPPPASAVAGLWTASGAAQVILRLSPEQLSHTGPVTAATTITTSSVRQFGLVAVAFDAAGNLWLADHADSALLMFTPAALAVSGTAPATVVIHPNHESLRSPTGLAFDRAGRLWVANRENGTLVRFDPPQLAMSGTPVPEATLTGLGHPTALAFDVSGSLWVSDGAKRTLMKLTQDQLETSGLTVPSVVIGAAELALQEPEGIAFDGAGNLWVANLDATVSAYGADQLSVSGTPAPRVVLSSNNGSLVLPVGLAFDAEGSLWVVNGGGVLARFGPGKLAVSGRPPADALLELPGQSLLWSAAFWPRPAGLPLAQN